jgi:uncharacterized membrane protein
MTSNSIHIHTAILPAVTGIIAIALLVLSKMKGNKRIYLSGIVFTVLTMLITTLTSCFGGASISKVESIPVIDSSIVVHHAWTAMITFLLSVLIGVLAIRSRKHNKDKRTSLLIFLLVIFLILFYLTSHIAMNIRPF